jgi:hypothetical protein
MKFPPTVSELRERQHNDIFICEKNIGFGCAGFLGTMAYAQSSVQLYGIVDAAIRHTTNEGRIKAV